MCGGFDVKGSDNGTSVSSLDLVILKTVVSSPTLGIQSKRNTKRFAVLREECLELYKSQEVDGASPILRISLVGVCATRWWGGEKRRGG